MLAFIIALKSKTISNSWTLVCELLERTLRSACNQTSQNFFVVIVCHEKPDIQFEHPKIHYVTVDFKPPVIASEGEMSKGYENVHIAILNDMKTDHV